MISALQIIRLFRSEPFKLVLDILASSRILSKFIEPAT